ncbi:LysM peptidoglycan-binding domain-containing protein [Micromonospora sp. DT47]|uniref:LysM peptidoglycan-binding domain-containing protein n=1 Tax=Micromonospora sp. DT47 TaxID=3393431 RepID=UPI003CF80EEA
MTAPRGSAARRAGQLLTGFGSLVVLVALLAGAPVALLAFAGNPLPDHLPTFAEVGTALTSRDDGQLFLRALAVVGWFGWATFAFSVLVELGAQAARRPAPRLPGMSRQQRAAAALVGSVALIIAASPAASAASALSHPTTAGPTTTGAAVHAAGPALAAGQAPAQPAGAKPVYQVARGDYLGEVAERYLDDFDRYREVAALNRLRDADRIHPGQLIRLPAEAEDSGAHRHATGKLVPAPRKPSPGPVAPGSTSPGEKVGPGAPTVRPQTPGGQTGPQTPGSTAGARTPGGATALQTPGGKAAPRTPAGQPAPGTGQPPAERPVGVPPAMAAGASQATEDDRINRPLAVSAVLAVASIVGAQIGALLGLRRRPARATAGRASGGRASAARAAASRASAAQALVSGRHRRD